MYICSEVSERCAVSIARFSVELVLVLQNSLYDLITVLWKYVKLSNFLISKFGIIQYI